MVANFNFYKQNVTKALDVFFEWVGGIFASNSTKMASLRLLFPIIILFSLVANAQSNFRDYPEYPGFDLGATWSEKSTTFKVWAPNAEKMTLRVYTAGDQGEVLITRKMKKGPHGVWSTALKGNLHGRYYTYQARYDGAWNQEVADPYAVACGVNGRRAMVVNWEECHPEGWSSTPGFTKLAAKTDAIIYELSIRDFSSHPGSGIQHKGQYLAFTEKGTKTLNGSATGLDYLQKLGITHVHLLPAFDFRSIDEKLPPDQRPYNWGYDPHLYGVPEGTYASDAFDGIVRIKEFKSMVQALHQAGIGVIMDVVYNHTGETENSILNQLVPGYYYRQNAAGGFSNASACGNETASERPMMRHLMLATLKHWMTAYHIDGFRFDLMGIHDLETMNIISRELHAIHPNVLLYGEGWTAGESPLPDKERALKAHVSQLDRIAVFSDDIRDAIKGHVFTPTERGFVSHKPGLEESIKFGVTAAIQHPQVDYSRVNYSKSPYATAPHQVITYASCHDNHTLWDRLALSAAKDSETTREAMQRLAMAIVLTSQGISFLHAGVEMHRTKNGEENSFDKPLEINWLDYSRQDQYRVTHDYVQQLIQLRKNHPSFRIPNAEAIRQHLRFLAVPEDLMVAYHLDGAALGDSWNEIVVVYNANSSASPVKVPEGRWTIKANGERISEDWNLGFFSGDQVYAPPHSLLICVKD